jgi:rhodanese-related sulfurtransferase
MNRTTPALAALALLACAPRPIQHPAAVAPGIVDPATALSLAAAGARLVDVRTPQEFAAGHVAGAVNIPHGDIARRAAEVGPPDAPVVVYCQSGRRSGLAAEALRGLGYTTVYDARRYDALAAAQGR